METSTSKSVAQEILQQLGGNKFIAMTGSKNFMADGNTLIMHLARNSSKANRLKITLTPMDTYTMVFYKGVTVDFQIKIVEVKKIEGVYHDQLQKIFTSVTGLDTHL